MADDFLDIPDPFDLIPFLSDLLGAEESAYRKSDWCDSSSSESSSEHVAFGSQLFGQGLCVEQIHGYFRSFESHHSCLCLTGGQSTKNIIRVMSDTHIVMDGCETAEDASVTPTEKTLLTDQEFRIFSRAMLCACCPLLTVPKLSDDNSSCSSVSTSPSNGPVMVQLALDHREVGHTLHYSHALHGRPSDFCFEEDFCLISSDVLQEVVRCAFRLGTDPMLRYAQLIRQQYRKKKEAKILAEDLLYQLSLLETRKHPYYAPHKFATTYCYEAWCQLCRRRILELVNKFWNMTLPPLGPEPRFDAQNIHADYTNFVHRLIRYENYQKQRLAGEFVLSDRLVLSGPCERLLAEFSLRYGIDNVYRKTVVLDFLVSNFKHEALHMKRTINAATDIINLIPKNPKDALFVQQQIEQLEQLSDALLGHCEQLLRKLHTLLTPQIQPSTVDFIGLILAMSEKAMELKIVFSTVPLKPLSQFIQDCIQISFCEAYQGHKTVESSELGLAASQLVSPQLVNRMVTFIRDGVVNYGKWLQTIFERHIDMKQCAAAVWYQLLMEDTAALCRTHGRQDQQDDDQLNKRVTTAGDVSIIGLMYRLNKLDSEWKQYIHASDQTWRLLFTDVLTRWLSVIHLQLLKFLLNIFSVEKFSALQIKLPRVSAPDWPTSGNSRASSIAMSCSFTPSYISAFKAVHATSLTNQASLCGLQGQVDGRYIKNKRSVSANSSLTVPDNKCVGDNLTIFRNVSVTNFQDPRRSALSMDERAGPSRLRNLNVTVLDKDGVSGKISPHDWKSTQKNENRPDFMELAGESGLLMESSAASVLDTSRCTPPELTSATRSRSMMVTQLPHNIVIKASDESGPVGFLQLHVTSTSAESSILTSANINEAPLIDSGSSSRIQQPVGVLYTSTDIEVSCEIIGKDDNTSCIREKHAAIKENCFIGSCSTEVVCSAEETNDCHVNNSNECMCFAGSEVSEMETCSLHTVLYSTERTERLTRYSRSHIYLPGASDSKCTGSLETLMCISDSRLTPCTFSGQFVPPSSSKEGCLGDHLAAEEQVSNKISPGIKKADDENINNWKEYTRYTSELETCLLSTTLPTERTGKHNRFDIPPEFSTSSIATNLNMSDSGLPQSALTDQFQFTYQSGVVKQCPADCLAADERTSNIYLLSLDRTGDENVGKSIDNSDLANSSASGSELKTSSMHTAVLTNSAERPLPSDKECLRSETHWLDTLSTTPCNTQSHVLDTSLMHSALSGKIRDLSSLKEPYQVDISTAEMDVLSVVMSSAKNVGEDDSDTRVRNVSATEFGISPMHGCDVQTENIEIPFPLDSECLKSEVRFPEASGSKFPNALLPDAIETRMYDSNPTLSAFSRQFRAPRNRDDHCPVNRLTADEQVSRSVIVDDSYECESSTLLTVRLTSSLIDVVCLLQRLVHVADMMTKTLCSVEVSRQLFSGNQHMGGDASVHQHVHECSGLTGVIYNARSPRQSSDNNAISDAESPVIRIRRTLRHRVLCILENVLTAYARNLLVMDMCGLDSRTAKRLAGDQVVNDAVAARKRPTSDSALWGCRHKVQGIRCRSNDSLAGLLEPVTREMCLRINLATQLNKIVLHYRSKVDMLWAQCGDVDVANERRDGPDWLPSYLHTVSRSLINILAYRLYAHVNDALDRVLKTVNAELTEQFFGGNSHQQRHLRQTGIAMSASNGPGVEWSGSSRRQSESAWRRRSSTSWSNSQANQAFSSEAIMPDDWQVFSAAICAEATPKLIAGLQPIMEFLVQRLVSLNLWLCDDDFQGVRGALCIHLAEGFEKRIQDLYSCESAEHIEMHAKILHTAIKLLVGFNYESTQHPDVNNSFGLCLTEHMNVASYWLELYNQPTNSLVELFEILQRQALGEQGYSDNERRTCSSYDVIRNYRRTVSGRRSRNDELDEVESLWDAVTVDPEVQSAPVVVPNRDINRTVSGPTPYAFNNDFGLESHYGSSLCESDVSRVSLTFFQSWRVNTNLLLTILLSRRYRDSRAKQFLLGAVHKLGNRNFEWINFRQEPVMECLNV